MVLIKKPSMIESPLVGRQKRPLDGILRVQKVAAVEKWFRGSPGCFQGIRVYISEGARSGDPRGGHELGSVPYPPGRAILPRGRLVASPTSSPSLLVLSGPRKIIAKVSFCLDSVWYSFSMKL